MSNPHDNPPFSFPDESLIFLTSFSRDLKDDARVRLLNMDQLVRAIDKNSAGRPAILAGDFNDLWTNERQSVSKITDAGFHDAWVTLVKGGKYPEPGSEKYECDVPNKTQDCETLDKIL